MEEEKQMAMENIDSKTGYTIPTNGGLNII